MIIALLFVIAFIANTYGQTTFRQQHCTVDSCTTGCMPNVTLPCGQCIPCHPAAASMCLSAKVVCHQPTATTIQEALFSTVNCTGTPYRTIFPDLVAPSPTFCFKWENYWVTNVCDQSADEDQSRIENYLDLSRFVPKLLKDQEKFYSAPVAWTAIVEYKRFLILKMKFPDVEIAPSPLVDEVWHMHILDTKRYMDDCNFIFGKYMHHVPSFEPDEEEQHEMFARFGQTMSLYKKVFGEEASPLIWPRISKGAVAECFLPSCCAMAL